MLVPIRLQLEQSLLLQVRGVFPFIQISPHKHVVQTYNNNNNIDRETDHSRTDPL